MERKFYPLYMGGLKREFAKVVVVGNLVFLSGIGGKAIETGAVTSDDVLEQTEVAVMRINSVLQELGLCLANMVKHTIYVKNGENPVAVARKFHDVCYSYAPSLREVPDAATLVIVSGFYDDDMKVEIDVIAAYMDSK